MHFLTCKTNGIGNVCPPPKPYTSRYPFHLSFEVNPSYEQHLNVLYEQH